MRATTAYFVGAGTVIVAIAAGLGGGLMIANTVSPTPAKQGTEVSLVERRKSPEPAPAAIGPSEPVQYLAAPSLPAAAAATPDPAQPAPQTEAVNSTPTTAPPAAVTAAAPAAQPATAPAGPTTAVAREPRPVAVEDAFAKAQEADIKRDAEVRRLVEKRKTEREKAERERRQQSVDKRRYRQHQQQEWRETEEIVLEEAEPRRRSAIEPAGIEMPRIKLFVDD